MIKVKFDELKKAILKLESEINGGDVTLKIEQTKIIIEGIDNYKNGVTVCLHDVDYPFYPTISKTERL